MGICNRDLDVTQQAQVYQAPLAAAAVAASAGNSYALIQVASPGTLQKFAVMANSISGAPVVSLDVKRFTALGVTTIANVGTSLALTAHGLSAAYQTMTLASAGSTLLSLQAGDVLLLNQNFSGGNVAAGQVVVSAVIQNVQDLKQSFGYPSTT